MGLPAAAAYGPLLWAHGQRLWAKEHFQFIPVYLAAVLYVVWQRFGSESPPPKGRWRVEPVTLCLGLPALAVAWVIHSPWLAALSLVLVGNAVLAWFPQTRQSWRLLILLIPLPLNLDQQLILRLQTVSSQLASRALDVLDVPHLRQGNIMELTSRRLFVEEACSGINSVYLLLAAVMFYLVLARARWVVAVPLVISTIAWSILANALRITAIAVADQKWQIDLTAGVPHDMIGIATTLFALLAIFSTNSLLQFLTGSLSDKQIRDPASSSTTLTPTVLWNTLTTSNLSLVYTHGRRGMSVSVQRWKLAGLLFVSFVACCSSRWGLQAWADWRGPEPQLPLPADTGSSASDRLAALTAADLEDTSQGQYTVTAADVHGIRPDEAAAHSRWNLSTGAWDAQLRISGPFAVYPTADATVNAQVERVAYRKIPVIGQQANMRETTSVLPDGRRLRAWTVVFRNSGEVISAHAQRTAGDLLNRFRSGTHTEQQTLYRVELVVEQSSSLSLPQRQAQE
ncbi:MAG: exosortase, partial [Planctomycetaceae bacterium]|nr:exosortase [Planctomycetaceae bacterium]